MEVYNAKGVRMYPPAAVFAIMLIILLNGYCCGASVLVKTNTTFLCDGRLDECLVEDDLELDILINPYVSRQLLQTDPLPNLKPGNEANNPKLPVFQECHGFDPKFRGNRLVSYHVCVAKFITNHHKCTVKNVFAEKGC